VIFDIYGVSLLCQRQNSSSETAVTLISEKYAFRWEKPFKQEKLIISEPQLKSRGRANLYYSVGISDVCQRPLTILFQRV